MAKYQQPEKQSSETVPQRFAETTAPQYHSSDYNFTIQALFEIQKSIGELTQATKTLSDDSKAHSQKLEHIGKVLYAATAIGTILLAVGGFLLSKIWSTLIEALKAAH
jgi:hypothetical protein